MIIETVKYLLRRGGIFHIWEHSWKIGEYNEWDELERIFKLMSKISKKPEVKLMNNTELIKYLS